MDQDEMAEVLRNTYSNMVGERRLMVALLSVMFPSVISRWVPDESGMDQSFDEWVVHIKLPTGQVSFRVGDERTPFFSHLLISNVPVYDGHSSDDKWRRIVAYIDRKAGGSDEQTTD